MNKGFSPSRRAWNRVMNALVWAAAILVMVLVAGIIGMVLVRGIPHISWKFLTTTASVLKKTDGILPAILNTLYVILLTLLIVLPLGVGAAVYLTEYASNRKLIEVIEFTNETLAGIPSIIYGLVGMLVFSQALAFQTFLDAGLHGGLFGFGQLVLQLPENHVFDHKKKSSCVFSHCSRMRKNPQEESCKVLLGREQQNHQKHGTEHRKSDALQPGQFDVLFRGLRCLRIPPTVMQGNGILRLQRHKNAEPDAEKGG